MGDECQNNCWSEEEEDEFKTLQVLENKKEKKKKKKITSETENHEEDGTMNLKVKLKSEESDRALPIVAYFPSGYDPKTDDRGSPKVMIYTDKAEMKKRLEVVVSPPGSSVEFVGSNYSGEQAASPTCENRPGVLDKETQTLTNLPIADNKIFRLEPRGRIKETVDSQGSENKKTALNRKRGSLLNKFIIPPYNASATTPKEAYPVEKIIGKEEWDFLQDIYWLLQREHAPATDTDVYPVFVRNRLYKLRDIKDETEKQTVTGVLSLLTHLVRFKDLCTSSTAENHIFPRIIREKFVSLFRVKEWKILSIDGVNHLISYVLVLSLHVDNFKTNPEDIAKDLRMSTLDLIEHFENLGCKIVRGKSIMLATLPVPLKLR